MTKRRPILRYPGGKFLLAPKIVPHFPQHKLYVEVFCGAASILMYKHRSEGEVINDIYDDVRNVFSVLQDKTKAKELKRLLELTPHSYREYLLSYDTEKDDDIERARKMIYRSFASIGSDGASRRHAGFRTLKNNESYVTSALEWSRFPKFIPGFTRRLQGVVLEGRDALDIIRIYDRPETFFYCDPPYVKDVRAKYSVHYAFEYSDDDHRNLAVALQSIQGTAIISGYKGELYKELYEDKGWKRVDFTAKVQTGTTAGGTKIDSIWMHPRIKTTLF